MSPDVRLRAAAMRALAAMLICLGVSVSHGADAAPAATDVPWRGCFEAASSLHDVPLDLLLAVAMTESALDADARSHADAHGVMQIQWPGTARHLGVRRVSELYNPCLNIELGARYLAELLARGGGRTDFALAAYNYGPTRIERRLAAGGELPAGARAYVDRVETHRGRIRAGATATVAAALLASGEDLVRFDEHWRAARLVVSLNERFDSAVFRVVSETDGTHAVRMRVTGENLSFADAARLRAYGLMEEDA